MLIATAEDNGQHFLIMGLTRENVERLTQGKPIRIRRDTHGNAVPDNLTLVIAFGETEADIARQWKDVGMVDDTTPVKPMPRR